MEKGGGHLSRSIDQECFVNKGKQKIFRISIIAEMGKCLLIGKVPVTIANVMNIDTWYEVCTPPFSLLEFAVSEELGNKHPST